MVSNHCRKLVDCSLEAEFDSAYDGEKIFRKLQFSGPGANFHVLANMQRLGMPGRLVHDFAGNYCIKMDEGSFKIDFYCSRDGEKIIPKL